MRLEQINQPPTTNHMVEVQNVNAAHAAGSLLNHLARMVRIGHIADDNVGQLFWQNIKGQLGGKTS